MTDVGVLGRAYGRPLVVAVGDSVTYGQHVAPEKRWTNLIQDAGDWTVFNKGVCGDTTRTGLERFPHDVQNQEARVVLIQFGYNDCNKWETDLGMHRVTLPAFKANLKEMVVRAQRSGAKAVLVPMFWADKGPDYRRWQGPYLSALDEMIRNCSHSMFNPFLNEKIETMDGLHPTPDGHVRIAEIVTRML